VSHKTSSETDSDHIIGSLEQREEDSVSFYGGEPTLRNNFLKIIDSAKSAGYRRIRILTNGRAFSDIRFLQQTVTAGCSLFEIKLWGSNPSLHDHLTRASGSFWETISGLENLAGLPNEKFISIRIPVCRGNHTDMENTVITALNFGVNRIILSLQDHTLSYQTLLPHIKNAINISIFNRVWILTEGLPFCMMQGLEQHVSEIYSGWNTVYERTFKQHRYCVDCIARELCPGIDAGYLKQFGDREFPPVSANRHLEDIRALYG
jgi:sulfatase maturation enzyme AslB (radical SAM superfamily)